jgi:hypothetical protein
MAISINNTTLTFNDATTQTTSGVTSVGVSTGLSSTGGKTPTLTNTGVTSLTGAGTVSVSSSTGAITITGTGGSGTVTSVATGNGLSGGTITSTGTLVVACPSAASVGSYMYANQATGGNVVFGGTLAGSNLAPAFIYINEGIQSQEGSAQSGTWRCMGISNRQSVGVAFAFTVWCRVS